MFHPLVLGVAIVDSDIFIQFVTFCLLSRGVVVSKRKRVESSPWADVPNWQDETQQFLLYRSIAWRPWESTLEHHKIRPDGMKQFSLVSNISEKNIGQDQVGLRWTVLRWWGRPRRWADTPLARLNYHFQPPGWNRQQRTKFGCQV